MQNRHMYELFCVVQAFIRTVWVFSEAPSRGLAMYKPQGIAPVPVPEEYQLKDGACLIMRGHFIYGIASPWGLIKIDSYSVGPWEQYHEELKRQLGLRFVTQIDGLDFYEARDLGWVSDVQFQGYAAQSTKAVLANWWLKSYEYQIERLNVPNNQLRIAV